MRVLFTDDAWNDYCWWAINDVDLLLRLNELIENVRRTPFTGIGKPEQLKGNLSKCWSRRLTREHRLVYQVSGKGEEQTVTILQCRFHY